MGVRPPALPFSREEQANDPRISPRVRPPFPYGLQVGLGLGPPPQKHQVFLVRRQPAPQGGPLRGELADRNLFRLRDVGEAFQVDPDPPASAKGIQGSVVRVGTTELQLAITNGTGQIRFAVETVPEAQRRRRHTQIEAENFSQNTPAADEAAALPVPGKPPGLSPLCLVEPAEGLPPAPFRLVQRRYPEMHLAVGEVQA